MKTFLIAMCACLVLTACDKEVEQQKEQKPVVVQAPPPPPPSPTVTNPFEKPPAPPPSPVHVPTQTSQWTQVGDPFKMNDAWSLWTWRDTAKHNTCYFYTAGPSTGMSCVKE